jgi:hypothetical protein
MLMLLLLLVLLKRLHTDTGRPLRPLQVLVLLLMLRRRQLRLLVWHVVRDWLRRLLVHRQVLLKQLLLDLRLLLVLLFQLHVRLLQVRGVAQ